VCIASSAYYVKAERKCITKTEILLRLENILNVPQFQFIKLQIADRASFSFHVRELDQIVQQAFNKSLSGNAAIDNRFGSIIYHAANPPILITLVIEALQGEGAVSRSKSNYSLCPSVCPSCLLYKTLKSIRPAIDNRAEPMDQPISSKYIAIATLASMHSTK